MSTIFRDADGHHDEVIYSGVADRPCNVCGESPDAFWIGDRGEAIVICKKCAVNILPRLIADAIRAKSDRIHPFHHCTTDITIAYWQAAACALAQRGKTRVLLAKSDASEGEVS